MTDQTPGWWVTFRHELPHKGDPPAGDPWREAARLLDLEATRYRYFVTFPGQDEREVSVDAWRLAEREAGFVPKLGPGFNATAGFSGNGIRGRTELIPAPNPDPEDWDDEAGTVQGRSDMLAASFGDVGVEAMPLPSLGENGAEPGVWLGSGDAGLVFRILLWAMSQGKIIDREKCGLPPLKRDRENPERTARPSAADLPDSRKIPPHDQETGT
jgi:hypothetical protein